MFVGGSNPSPAQTRAVFAFLIYTSARYKVSAGEFLNLDPFCGSDVIRLRRFPESYYEDSSTSELVLCSTSFCLLLFVTRTCINKHGNNSQQSDLPLPSRSKPLDFIYGPLTSIAPRLMRTRNPSCHSSSLNPITSSRV